MKLIVGLWNPGKQYETTRHNLGFIFVDKFAEENNFSEFKYESKLKADISTGMYAWEKTLLVKPQTFMNLSWESIRKITDFYKLLSDDFVIVYDDKDMEFGKVRYRSSGSAGWHNGIKDIIRLFSADFPRIKVGIGCDKRYATADWVLSKFLEEELIDLDGEVYDKIIEKMEEEFI